MTMKTTKTKQYRRVYFDWLYHQIEDKNSVGLENFIYELYSIPFVCHIPNDDNRAADGLLLRDKFAEAQNIDYFLPGPCTVLEMLIALANRMDFILFDSSNGNRRSVWFWLFINNLKLQKYANDEEVGQKKKINHMIIKKFVERDYQENGKGGLFPLDNPSCNQRDVEIWYQMMYYISENYGI